METIKKTYELDKDIVDIIESSSRKLGITQKELIELAILKPTIYITSLKILMKKESNTT